MERPGRVPRTHEHEVDTAACRRVHFCFGREWEHRELTGRDYGIDQTIELFEAGEPTGRLLLLQIKGVSGKSADPMHFDVPVSTLKYAEMFVAPVLLCLCPVDHDQPFFRYVWLQEYARVVLEKENPGWRANASTVRVHFPVDNRMPGRDDHLRHAAAYPHRLEAAARMVRTSVRVEEFLSLWDGQRKSEITGLLEAARRDLAALGAGDADRLERQYLERGIQSAAAIEGSGSDVDRGHHLNVRKAVRTLLLRASVFFDYDLRYVTWQTHSDHDF